MSLSVEFHFGVKKTVRKPKVVSGPERQGEESQTGARKRTGWGSRP